MLHYFAYHFCILSLFCCGFTDDKRFTVKGAMISRRQAQIRNAKPLGQKDATSARRRIMPRCCMLTDSLVCRSSSTCEHTGSRPSWNDADTPTAISVLPVLARGIGRSAVCKIDKMPISHGPQLYSQHKTGIPPITHQTYGEANIMW